MRLVVDTDRKVLTVEEEGIARTMELFSTEAFELIAEQWLKVGWNQKYAYNFTWLGRPVIQLPEDMIRIQEVIYRLKPDVILETGIAHGGSLVFHASLCEVMNRGRVIGVDIEIRPHNRKVIEEHELFHRITLIEGDSVARETVDRIKSLIKPGESCLVILDSCHEKKHVLAELEAYHDLVTPDSYIVATDGMMRDLYDVPRGRPNWATDNPAAAAKEFVQAHPDFEIEQPPWPFNESELSHNVTHWPEAFLKRK